MITAYTPEEMELIRKGAKDLENRIDAKIENETKRVADLTNKSL